MGENDPHKIHKCVENNYCIESLVKFTLRDIIFSIVQFAKP